MAAKYYRVVITNPGGIAVPGEGFIDPTRTETYITNTESPPSDFTNLLSIAKRKANLRYLEIINQISQCTNVTVDPLATLVPAGTYKIEPTSITLMLQIPAGIFSLVTVDEIANTSPPTMITDPVLALQRMIARALTGTRTRVSDVFDPTPLATIGNVKQVPRFGPRVTTLTIGPVAVSIAAATSLIAITAITT